jgi:dienelactone hydrolase
MRVLRKFGTFDTTDFWCYNNVIETYRKTKMKIFIVVLTLLMLPTKSFSQNDISKKWDIPKTWENAQVYVPGNWFTRSVNTVEVSQPMPVVILMHGCGGIDQNIKQWASLLKDNGYIVVLPDSFAMPGRVQNCDPKTKTRNLGLIPVHKLRLLEMEYATSQVKQQTWVDKNNIFLMGHSEGSVAVASAPDLGINGVIISGYVCRRGVQTDIKTPIMSVNFEQDPYFYEKNITCSDQWGNRTNGKQVTLSGYGHATSQDSTAKEEVLNFLKSYSK